MAASAEASGRHAAAAAAARPLDADAQMFYGNALADAGHAEAAIAAYRAALRLRPDHAPSRYNLGNALLATGDLAGAEAEYRAALALAPDHAGCHNNLGNALRRLGRPEAAAEAYRGALRLRPELFGTLSNLGSTLLALHRPEAALETLQAALALRPDYAEACENMGGTLLALDRPEDALAWFRRATALDPAQVTARFGEALALLSLGRLAEGFQAYEARWLDPRFREGSRTYDAPLWRGETPLAGRTLLLHAEQGLGDTIQFVRYAAVVRAMGARVVLEVPRPLLRLLAPLADAAVAEHDPLPPHDLRVPLLSLPVACGTTLATIPATVPYLRQPAPMPGVRGPGLNVALTIAGNRDHPEDALRSLPAAELAPLLELLRRPEADRRAGAHPHPALRATLPTRGRERLLPPPCGEGWGGGQPDAPSFMTLHLVQPQLTDADRTWLDALPQVRRHGPALADFADTAALLTAMDLVISVDTAAAHLAGALGLPLWVLLQHAADFRWLRGRDDSPWYPTARLFRQGPDRRWPPVLARVRQALEACLPAPSPPPTW